VAQAVSKGLFVINQACHNRKSRKSDLSKNMFLLGKESKSKDLFKPSGKQVKMKFSLLGGTFVVLWSMEHIQHIGQGPEV